MTLHVAPVVEGHGEVLAVPLLIRRVAAELLQLPVKVERPYRLPKGQMVKAAEMGRVATLMCGRVDAQRSVLTLVDADGDEPDQLRRDVLAAAGRPITCVVAVREYEAWLLAGESRTDVWDPNECERIRDAKGQLEQVTGLDYREVRDQAGATARLDLHAALQHSPSFRTFVDTLRQLADD